jgi:DNA-binding PadR family transcriptional regulator
LSKDRKIRYLILGLLVEENLSGYDIKQKIDKKMGALWMESYGQIYPELKKLTEEKMISLKASIRQGRMYKEYSITNEGKNTLLIWLKKPIENNKIVKYDILLKLFFAKYLEPGEFMPHLKKFQNDFEKALQNLLKMKEILGPNPQKSKDMVYWYLTALFGETIFSAYIDWAKKSSEILKKMDFND